MSCRLSKAANRGCSQRALGVTLHPQLSVACWGGHTTRDCWEWGSKMFPPSRTGPPPKCLLMGHSIKACPMSNIGLETTEQDLILETTRKAAHLRQPSQPVRDGERSLTLQELACFYPFICLTQ